MKNIIVILTILAFALPLVGQQQGAPTDEQLQLIRCQGQVTVFQVDAETWKRRAEKAEKELAELKKAKPEPK